jgi:acyl-CoA synthetase (AMP-forming)/AMP-acid ligase II/aryl carrier-like protein
MESMNCPAIGDWEIPKRSFDFSSLRPSAHRTKLNSMNIATEVLRNDPNLVAFVDVDDRHPPILYRDIGPLLEDLAEQAGLPALPRSARVALIMPRGKDGLLGFLAVSSYAVCCPLDPRLLEEELVGAIRDLNVAAIVDGTGEPRIASIAERLKIGMWTLRVPERSSKRSQKPRIGRTQANEVALLLQTSGTTSKPKHVALTHSNVLAAAGAIGKSYAITPRDLCINPMPHHHVHGLISAGTSSLLAGASQYCAPSFSPAAFDKAVDLLNPTWFTGSPAFHLGLLDYFKASGRVPATRSLRFMRSSSAPFPASAIAQYEQLFGVPLLENYGMTETASTVCTNMLPPGLRKPGSVGGPIGAEIRIVDASSGHERSAGSEGEVLLRGPSVITRYASGESGPDHFMDGWLRTGDVGRVDKDGCLFILGRTKELVKRGGHSVYPLEVDSAILLHPEVMEAISFSLEHPTLGEELVAAIVARAGSTVDGNEIRDFLDGRISTYKIPAAIIRVREIPKSATGKSARRAMRAAFAAEFALKSVAPESELETALLDAWVRVNDVPDLGVTDNLFVHGGDPIRAQRVCDDLRQRHGVVLSLKDVIRNPTVRMQANLAPSRTGLSPPTSSPSMELPK